MRKYVFSLLLIILLYPNSIKASCDYNEYARLKRIASNITTMYDYKPNGDGVIFNITISNLTSDLYIYDNFMNKRYDYINGGEINIDGYNAGYSVKFDVYTTNSSCTSPFLITHYVSLPSYNIYYKDPLCSEIESSSLCYKWGRIDMNYDQFKKAVDEYKKSKEKPIIEEEKPEVYEKTIFNFIGEIFISYWYIILPSIIVVSLGGIIILNNRNRFGL